MTPELHTNGSQCQFFVVRKKRLCRMTVRPGRNYCGEHQPKPIIEDGKHETRIPCPNDPKHTCFASKLKKHLSICNARQQELPVYIKSNVNAPVGTSPLKQPLSEVPCIQIQKIINKVNLLFNRYLKDKIEILSEKQIHPVIMKDFLIDGRTESSLRHLRQASRLMYVIEDEELIHDNTCYVELGAGKGHLSYFVWQAWCPAASNNRVLLVERAALRHKRDNKIRDMLQNKDNINKSQQLTTSDLSDKVNFDRNHRNDSKKDDDFTENKIQSCDENDGSFRLRADLADLILHLVPVVQSRQSIVGFAKHLCGVATDYSLRCLSSDETLHKTRGVVIATCCHHRCNPDGYVAYRHLLDLGIDESEFNILLGIVSWATCGDGRSREKRKQKLLREGRSEDNTVKREIGTKSLGLTREQQQDIGRRVKALLDWGRVLYLKEYGFNARLAYFIPHTISLENLCIIAKRNY